jgi:hypothetical protein
MKKLLILCFLFAHFICKGQQGNVSIAHRNAVKYLLKDMNDPTSYKSVDWGVLEKVFIKFDDTQTAKILISQIEGLKNSNSTLTETNRKYILSNNAGKNDTLIHIWNDQISKNLKSIDSLTKIQAHAKELFKPVFSCYYMEHKFRAKNGFNATVLKTYTFILDKKLNVLGMGDNAESEQERQNILERITSLN